VRFVLGNRHLIAAGGTEVHLVTIGEHLERLGHEVVLYAPELGAFAEHARACGLAVCGSLHELPAACDVVFSQDAIVAYPLADRYGQAFHVFRVCGDVYDFQLPPQLAGVVDRFVVLSERYEKVVRTTAASAGVPILRLPVPIDTDRLVPLGPLRERPAKAVLLGNYVDREQLIRDVWGGLGVQVTRVGGHAQSFDVARSLADADVVVAKSRAALDAMACGRAVYLFDMFGGDGWVTPELYPALADDNFAGQATGRVIDAAALAADLATFDPAMGATNRDLVLQHHNARDHVLALLDIIPADVRERAPGPTDVLRELGRLTALQSSWEVSARELRTAFWPLRRHADDVQAEAAKAHAAAVADRAEATRAHAAAADAEQRRHLVTADLARVQQRADEATAEVARLKAELNAMQATRARRLIAVVRRLRSRLRRRA
jgi:hypothetical protein